MPKSDDPCATSGIYKGSCEVARHPGEVVMVEGETFPKCGECGESVVWELAGGLSSLRPEAPGGR
jgi:hypothetical protein